MDYAFDFAGAVFKVFGVVGILVLLTAGCSFLLFRFLGSRWLESKFSERLEAYKHAQNKELERVKYEMNSLFDRSSKIRQYEYETLPETWRQLVEAFYHARDLTSGLRQYVDISRMSDDRLRSLLERQNFQPHEVEDVISSHNKLDVYRRITDAKHFGVANDKVYEFRIRLKKYGIFINKPLEQKLEALDDLINTAMIEMEMGLQGIGSGSKHEKALELRQKGGALMAEVKEEIHKHLWSVEMR